MCTFNFEIMLGNALAGIPNKLDWDEEDIVIFGAVKSADVPFCSIECARHNGCEPTRMLLPGEHIGLVCDGCGIELDTEDRPTRVGE